MEYIKSLFKPVMNVNTLWQKIENPIDIPDDPPESGDWRKTMLRRMVVITTLTLLLGTAACGCAARTGQTTAPTTAPTGTTSASTATSTATPGTPPVGTSKLEPIIVPTLPDIVPAYLQVDPDTGLHMTGTPTVVDFPSYRLKVSGHVVKELSLTYDELRRLPKVTASPELVCEGFFVDVASWSGAPLKTILEMAGVQSEANSIVMKSADGFSARLNLEDACATENFLAYELAGQTLPVLQGFPLRAVLPGKTGFLWVKWLLEIVVE